MLRYGLTQMEKSESVFIPVVSPRTGVMTPNTLASFTACPASFPAGALVGLATGLLALTSVFAVDSEPEWGLPVEPTGGLASFRLGGVGDVTVRLQSTGQLERQVHVHFKLRFINWKRGMSQKTIKIPQKL